MSSQVYFTDEEIEFLKANFAKHTNKELAKLLNRSLGGVKGKIKRLGLRRNNRKVWTAEELKILTENYPTMPSAKVAEMLNIPLHVLHSKAYSLGLYKTPEHIKATLKMLNDNLQKSGKANRFQKGQKPWSAGKKLGTRGRSAETQFKKGQKPSNLRPIGGERISKDGYIEIKVDESKFWELKHRVVWEKHHGKIPDSHCIWFKDLNPLNCDIENLEMISRVELLNRNTIHRYPPEIKELIHTLAGLKRRIKNKKEKQYAQK